MNIKCSRNSAHAYGRRLARPLPVSEGGGSPDYRLLPGNTVQLENTIHIGLQIYEGRIVKSDSAYRRLVGWLVSSSSAPSRNHALSARLFPPLLGRGERKRV